MTQTTTGLVLEESADLIGQATALFSRCDLGHAPGGCRLADAAGNDERPCRQYRYRLTRTWNPALPEAVFVIELAAWIPPGSAGGGNAAPSLQDSSYTIWW